MQKAYWRVSRSGIPRFLRLSHNLPSRHVDRPHRIENFRTFRKTRIDFCHADKEYGAKLPQPRLPNVNLLLANNGFGKTTLLRAIALAALGPAVGKSGIFPYCERKLESENYGKGEQDVEHFRPKKNVRPWKLPKSQEKLGVTLTPPDPADGGYHLLAKGITACEQQRLSSYRLVHRAIPQIQESLAPEFGKLLPLALLATEDQPSGGIHRTQSGESPAKAENVTASPQIASDSIVWNHR